MINWIHYSSRVRRHVTFYFVRNGPLVFCVLGIIHKLFKGAPSMTEIEELAQPECGTYLLVLDDLWYDFFVRSRVDTEIGFDFIIFRLELGDETLSRLFTVGRHLNLSVVFISQSLFLNTHLARVALNNAKYYVLFCAKRTLHTVRRLLTQSFSKGQTETLMRICRKLSITPYNYLLVDYAPETCDSLRAKSRYFHKHLPPIAFVMDE